MRTMKKITILVMGLFIYQSILASSTNTEVSQQNIAKEKLNVKIESKDTIRSDKQEIAAQSMQDGNSDRGNISKPLEIRAGDALYLIYDRTYDSKDTAGMATDKIKVTRIQRQGNKKKITQSTISRSTFLEIKKINDNLKYINRELDKIQAGSSSGNEQLRDIIPILNLEKIQNDMHHLRELLEGRKIK